MRARNKEPSQEIRFWNENRTVLGLARGGVPVGFEIAKTSALRFDVYVVRKLGVPGHEDLPRRNCARRETATQPSYNAEVYLPAGEYVTKRTIILPRGPQEHGFTIRGEGVSVTSLVGHDSLATSQLVMCFDSTPFDSYFFKLEGMVITRGKPGAVFAFHPSMIDPMKTTRMYCAVFRNVYFRSPIPSKGPTIHFHRSRSTRPRQRHRKRAIRRG
jgi:hypothetical protein